MLANTYRVRSAAAGYSATLPRRVRVHVGAPPAIVEAGLPGARDEVRAYATRIDDAWRQFWRDDVKPWAEKNLGESEEPSADKSTIGDIIGSDAEQVAEQRRKMALLDQIRDARSSFNQYRDEISSFSITGPSPSEAWQALQLHETSLLDARRSLEAETKVPLKSKKPAALEVPGGVKQGVKEAAEGVAKAIPWGTIATIGAVGLIGAVLLLKK